MTSAYVLLSSHLAFRWCPDEESRLRLTNVKKAIAISQPVFVRDGQHSMGFGNPASL